jgi:hypothetical protein
VLLFPAALLVLLALGITAIDSAVTFLAQRELSRVSEAVATEVVAAVDVHRFLAGDGEIALDAELANGRIASIVRRAANDPLFADVACPAPRVDGLEVTVTCGARLADRFGPRWTPSRGLEATTTVIGRID